MAIEYGADEDEAIGALLHDAAEDGGGEATLAEIRARFGDAVADIVLGCSDSLVEDPEDKLPWRERKENYLAHLENASTSVCLVSAADKLHNVRSIMRDYREHGEDDLGALPGPPRRHVVVLRNRRGPVGAPIPHATLARSARRPSMRCWH